MLFEHLKSGCEYRHIPERKSSMLFGVGFFDKSNWQEDQTHLITDHYSLVYVINGHVDYIDEAGVVYKLGAGDYFQRIPGVEHTTIIDPLSKYFECFVGLSFKCYEACCELGIIPYHTPTGHIGISLELIESFSSLKKKFAMDTSSNNAKLALQCQELILNFFNVYKGNIQNDFYSKIIDEACLLLGDNFDQQIDLKRFAQKHQCNYHSFRRKFKEYTGTSPIQYRNKRRLNTAMSLLKQNKLTISEIAWELGYSSPFGFSAQFKQHFGVAPRHFRNDKKNMTF